MVSLALPDWMYQTSLQGSSCEKSACPFLYLMTRREAPALERYSSTSKLELFFVFRAVLATGIGSLLPIMSRLVSKVNGPELSDSRVLRAPPAGSAPQSHYSLELSTHMELTTTAVRGTLPK